jgi:leader peptidase (prepilin peptidase)/N-methyltransferase
MSVPFGDPLVFVPFVALLGLFVGSFLNVVIYRLPIMMERAWQAEAAELREEPLPDPGTAERFNLAQPRSRCPHCGHAISALENIPLVSYLLLRGRCRACHAPISLRYPLVELLTAALSGYAAWHFGYGLAAAGALVYLWVLIALAFIDFDTQLLPDNLTLPLLWLGLAFNLDGTYVQLAAAVIGAMAGYLCLWAVYWLFKLVTGKEGMGYGDFKLLAAIGAWLGWHVLPLVLLLASLAGAIIGGSLIVLKLRERSKPIPFGPFLAIAGLIALFQGEAITTRFLLT